MTGPPPPQKLCPSCGTTGPEDANLCSKCGYSFHAGPYSQPPGPPQPGYRSSPHWQPNYPREGQDNRANPTADGLAIASLVLGILALPSFCIWCVSGPFALAGLIL